jgi:hypothetical protein
MALSGNGNDLKAGAYFAKDNQERKPRRILNLTSPESAFVLGAELIIDGGMATLQGRPFRSRLYQSASGKPRADIEAGK